MPNSQKDLFRLLQGIKSPATFPSKWQETCAEAPFGGGSCHCAPQTRLAPGIPTSPTASFTSRPTITRTRLLELISQHTSNDDESDDDAADENGAKCDARGPRICKKAMNAARDRSYECSIRRIPWEHGGLNLQVSGKGKALLVFSKLVYCPWASKYAAADPASLDLLRQILAAMDRNNMLLSTLINHMTASDTIPGPVSAPELKTTPGILEDYLGLGNCPSHRKAGAPLLYYVLSR
ncbi:hypothetical protein MBM_03099 [Drepanopeziza brunnea f. sp. 'multigermtubi' MB_m1]|uniref:Uncharacterized protein n=1 Tax=Marssonina brunnea f. sp. multigermtubi (strain MB_m1) TaxID=1072389 RepID=K1X1F7_MARBU|nr:uncharacterized protein MBM_03099 [Drepanopeziza brunnea f. sp. 'multigermtubi' MB_m1]EKD18857.1 hypothetical protein MBM_03099 [Drepanopeziza brunnea f. sp. 'multigermtubi' MB_m1]